MINFVAAHWAELLTVVIAVLYVGEKIVKLTPTDADDKIVTAVEDAVIGIGLAKRDAGGNIVPAK
jgi:hypothetical protein